MSSIIEVGGTKSSPSSEELQDGLLNKVVCATKLTGAGEPDYSDVIGDGPDCLFKSLPPIPDLFTSKTQSKKRKVLSERDFWNDVHKSYMDRYVPHLAYELRGQISGHFFDLVTACREIEGDAAKEGPQADVFVTPAATRNTSTTGSAAYTAADAWRKHTPLNKHLPRLCIQALANSRTFLSDDTFSVVALENTASPASIGRICYSGTCPVDMEVETAATNGITMIMSTNTIAIVLIPLWRYATMYEAYRKKRKPNSRTASAEELDAEVEEVLSGLHSEWRLLGCVPRLARVRSIDVHTKKAELSLYDIYVPESYKGPSLSDLVFDTTNCAEDVLYLKKLTSLGSANMELKAVMEFGKSRFLKLLHDPTQTKDNCVEWVDQISALPADGIYGKNLLDQHQRAAVNGVLHATYPELYTPPYSAYGKTRYRNAPDIVMIEGPPGTGKTQTIAMSIINVLKHGEELYGRRRCPRGQEQQHPMPRVLYVAPSNCAVDEGLLRFRKILASGEVEGLPANVVSQWKVLRIGLASKVEAKVMELQPFVFINTICHYEVHKDQRYRHLSDARRIKSRDAVKRKLTRTASVIFTTLGSLHGLRSYLPAEEDFEDYFFDAVIVDEASQCTEPAVLQALSMVNKGGSCILVGDSKQLQPTILSREASQCGLRRSLLVRMLACGHKSFLLRTQYRMHPDICAFPNAYFYDSKLDTHFTVEERQKAPFPGGRLAVCDLIPKVWSRLVMRDVHNGRMSSGRSRSASNLKEAEAVVSFLRKLRSRLNFTLPQLAAQVGIITFYKAQQSAINTLLAQEEKDAGLQVATVDSFQGREKRIILLSCVWTGMAQRTGVGFLSQWNRLNVALTRAQDLCVCFCNLTWVRSLGVSVHAANVSRDQHKLTTLASTAEEVKMQLDAHDKDTRALYEMWAHLNAKTEEVCQVEKRQQERQRQEEQERLRIKKQRRKNKLPHRKFCVSRPSDQRKRFFIGPGD